ncbi:uncharacterized protein LOC111635428 [Centruroides sculpturatus]|uniref:uncharacterized protein LOC111635409 n=1 Tax=Centruroides sculpturatus TaxID=218467 RepID=UPI000C6EEFCD|nr:uncharacterized protein LOC111635409 [Centruroides sculpturatus]XP_023236155.1 uncharacterized protein LOC111635428 [Centruroides sculpturatus]
MCFRINRFCCFKNTKNGSLACAFYTGIVSLGGIITNSVVLALFDRYKQKLYDFNKGKIDQASIQLYFRLSLSSAVVLFLVSTLLYVGIKKERRRLTVPWMVWMAVLIAVQLCSVFFLFLIIKANPIILLQCFVIVLFSAVNIYCFACVYSQYKTLQEIPCSKETQILRSPRTA